MDKDRLKGMGNQIKGDMKRAAGEIAGDPKLEAEGRMDKTKGKVQSAVGGAKDTVRETMDKDDKV